MFLTSKNQSATQHTSVQSSAALYRLYFILTGAELSCSPLDRTILPRTSTPSVVMFPAALMDFSPITEQSNTTFTDVLLMITWSWMGDTEQAALAIMMFFCRGTTDCLSPLFT